MIACCEGFVFENGVVSNGSQTISTIWLTDCLFENGVVSNGSQTHVLEYRL